MIYLLLEAHALKPDQLGIRAHLENSEQQSESLEQILLLQLSTLLPI